MKPYHRWLPHAAFAIILLNLLDGVLTLAIVYGDLAVEANPLMDVALTSWGSTWFMTVKLALVSLGVTLLWRNRHRPTAVFGLGSMAGVYAVLALYHVQSVSALARFLADSPMFVG